MRLFVMRTAIVTFIACSVMLGFLLWQTGPVPTALAEDSQPRVINVSGQGQILRSPDMATVYLSVETSGRTAQIAMEQNARIMTAVIDSIKSLDIEDRHIQTTGLSLYPMNNRAPILQDDTGGSGGTPGAPAPPIKPDQTPPEGPRFPVTLSYRAFNQVRVTVYDIAKMVWVIDGSVSKGATMVSGVNFGLKDSKQAQQDALRAAVEDARAQADLLAQSLGVTITGVQTASENSNYRGGPYPLPVGAPGAGGGVATPVQPGELSVYANVSVSYLIQ